MEEYKITEEERQCIIKFLAKCISSETIATSFQIINTLNLLPKLDEKQEEKKNGKK